MKNKDKSLQKPSSRSEIDAFLENVASTAAIKPAGKQGRLIFAMDATASREPTWDYAAHIQAQMFNQTSKLGGLEIQLCYFRGFGEFQAFPWMNNSQQLLKAMTSVFCEAGHTQIEKVLQHAIKETQGDKVDALVFVGDCMEEDVDRLGQLAGELGLHGVPIFIFHEGGEAVAARAFKQIARLSKGAYCLFDSHSPQQLLELLSAVAVYAAGGHKALTDYSQNAGKLARQLNHQIEKL